MTQPVQPHCHLLDLSKELRLAIYEELLVTQTPISIADDRPRPAEIQQIHLQPQLLRTCSQILNEGAEVLYGSKTFEAVGHVHGYVGRPLRNWLKRIGKTNVARLNHMTFCLLYPPPKRSGFNHALCVVETCVRIRYPCSATYTARCCDIKQSRTAELDPDAEVEAQLDSMSLSDETLQLHDIMTLYDAAVRVMPRRRTGTNAEELSATLNVF